MCQRIESLQGYKGDERRTNWVHYFICGEIPPIGKDVYGWKTQLGAKFYYFQGSLYCHSCIEKLDPPRNPVVEKKKKNKKKIAPRYFVDDDTYNSFWVTLSKGK